MNPRRVGGRVRNLTTAAQKLADDYRARNIRLRKTVIDRASVAGRVFAMSQWVELAPMPTLPVSVVLATRNRVALLPRAIESVLTQRHRMLQLVVVNDGSTDATADFLSNVADARVDVVTTTGVGLAAARNQGLDRVTSPVVAYVDDDNIMHPLWLKAVAWAFERYPALDLLYGARLVEDMSAINGVDLQRDVAPTFDSLPLLDFYDYDRDALERGNYLDINALAHRTGVAGARFDETTSAASDWDLILRMTERTPPLAFPVIACLYATRHEGRLLAEEDLQQEFGHVRGLLDRRRSAGDALQRTE